jgi:hypothetical protein
MRFLNFAARQRSPLPSKVNVAGSGTPGGVDDGNGLGANAKKEFDIPLTLELKVAAPVLTLRVFIP